MTLEPDGTLTAIRSGVEHPPLAELAHDDHLYQPEGVATGS